MDTLERIWELVAAFFGGILRGFERSLTWLIGSSNERTVKRLRRRVIKINALEPKYKAMGDEELKGQTAILKQRLGKGETLDDILEDAFAVCREASVRLLGMRHYDVQLMGGIALHEGNIAEMVTGEGKTLTATLPAYLNALEGKGVHVVTVNDYLARRDMEWMATLYMGLGLTVGAIQSQMPTAERQKAYSCDITYGTNNEFGFDYLRDNMRQAARGDNRFPSSMQQSQGPLNYAIVDEVDNILIDEARTPLIISGEANRDLARYKDADRIARQLREEEHFKVNEKDHNVLLTDDGVREAERLAGVESFYTAGNMEWPHLIDNALKAHHLYKRDVNYVIEKDEIVIIDEFTGRKQYGRQWSDGLHQAIECKEGVKIKQETETLATITLQNFFKLYNKLSGMTGTAMTEANEFYKIYKLDVIAIPTNRGLQRTVYPDMIYGSTAAKINAVVAEIERVNKYDVVDVQPTKDDEDEFKVGLITSETDEEITLQPANQSQKARIKIPKSRVLSVSRKGRPILVGTTSIEKSEQLADLLTRRGVKHEVLNAKNHEREAEIVSQAGRRGAVTIATNMAGRGTDIVLGGNPETMAWARLKDKYPTRLEVPDDEWNALVSEIEKSENMKVEGREVAAMGGLHVIGTERHEARRIDLQLIGRSGRQGDPGSARFYLSLEDDLMRIFIGDWTKKFLERLGMTDDQAIESRMVSKRIQAAQRKVEERNFEIRKNLLEYDEVMDSQRKRTYSFRQAILDGASTKELIQEMADEQIDEQVDRYLSREFGAQAFATFAGSREKLGIVLDPREFRGGDYEDCAEAAREMAERRAEDQIYEELESHLPEGDDRSDWNWGAMTVFLNHRFGLSLRDQDLKKVEREDLLDFVMDKVRANYEKVDLSEGRELLAPDFGLRACVEWARRKFDLPDLSITDLHQGRADEADPQQVKQTLREITRAGFERREQDLPVNYVMARSTIADAAATRLDKERCLLEANRRFDAAFTEEDFRNKQRNEIRDMLVEAGREHRRRAAAAYQEAERQVAELFAGVPQPRRGQPSGITAAVAGSGNDKLQKVADWLQNDLGSRISIDEIGRLTREKLSMRLRQAVDTRFSPEIRYAERRLLLDTLDEAWKTHLQSMDYLRSAVSTRGYGQMDPKVEYKREGMKIFEEMWRGLSDRVTEIFFRLEVVPEQAPAREIFRESQATHAQAPAAVAQVAPETGNGTPEATPGAAPQKVETIRNFEKDAKPGRNEKCWCGSGKKFKQCCEPLIRQGLPPKWGDRPKTPV
jgi:preprotein translocase subunit SecA